MRYLPHTDDDIRQMLEAIGVSSVDELFSAIPADDRLQRPLDLPPALSEPDLLRELDRLAELNTSSARALSFLGGGAYNHFIPAAVDHLVSRSEFYTAYTPYQPEIGQGTLQAIFEYQTLICQLTGMDVANASMYDGASATAEAALMAVRATRRRKLLLSAGLHPEYRQTVASYCRYLGLELVEVTLAADGRTDADALAAVLDTTVAAVIVGYPNFYGVIEPLADLADKAHACGAMLVSATAEPVSLGLLKSPGEQGVDIAVGEGQSFGLPVAYGGPGVGFFAARKKAVRSMPGRLIGETLDKNGERGFVLTLATREQHIRREKATSNICSNQGLCALMVAIYLALLGKQGIRELAEQNLAKAEYAKRQIASLPGFLLPYQAPTFNEFVVATPRPAAELLRRLEADNILGGIDLARFDAADANRLLVCVTEQNSRDDIDRLVAALKGGAA
ncbi:aminomethyl-transferring glycine dehydrogenase [Geothermobacter hydrogeniphilus]|uniref:Probable glycine dehydrogenase (decarboxylating) subunit 1 n=1 Tax=Geothermobacter hydrogeniphilus TaxID=1969733 RepID=A0A2K2H7T1_9BACT|nr:aminomethyl-transferring glycine dehydrogenase subunit GcvPA [Geothermobacter hydrogeniphilus]PNU19358.1 aminomethyl-transferring glycine dehydrogenase [Geothermobacter hydrogeniphilus]